MDTINDNFKKLFPKLAQQFPLKPFQEEVVKNVLEGNSAVAIMPTGGGKSLIYWLSGLSLKGITMVVSPLIALIDEQALKIEEQGYSVFTIHSGLSGEKQIDELTKFYHKELNPDFIFVSPERLATDGFFQYCLHARKDEVKLFVIDEIHCVSQWGVDFRPFYKRIPDFLNHTYNDKWPTILGLTATINPKELADISSEFKISELNILKDDLLVRSEIELVADKQTDENKKEDRLWQLLQIHKDEKVLVYLYRKYFKRGTEELMDKALEKGFRARNFHGDMSGAERQQIIDEFKSGNIDVIFATNAFGLGIDIPDIRVVIHFMIPESVEQYYQEIGRAGRDKQAARAIILYSNKNIQVRGTHFIDKSFPSTETIERVHKKVTNHKLGLMTLTYFDDEEIQDCLPYFIDNGVLSIKVKGFSRLRVLNDIKDPLLNKYFESTKSKNIIITLEKNNLEAQELIDLVYEAIISGKAQLTKRFDKCLIVENHYSEIPESLLAKIENDIEENRSYKHDLLRYLAYLLDDYSGSKQLHQEIGLYLGVPKFKLGKIYKTQKGDLVRSKSEVIIANMLYTAKINYQYEEKLYYHGHDHIAPDYTIEENGKIYYWEHLGMIGSENYDKRWLEKMDIYEKYYSGQLIKTYESAVLVDSVRSQIEELKILIAGTS